MVGVTTGVHACCCMLLYVSVGLSFSPIPRALSRRDVGSSVFVAQLPASVLLTRSVFDMSPRTCADTQQPAEPAQTQATAEPTQTQATLPWVLPQRQHIRTCCGKCSGTATAVAHALAKPEAYGNIKAKAKA